MKALYLGQVLLVLARAALAQQATIDPQLRTSVVADHQVVVITLTPHFVTTIRLPEAVNSVVVGDPALFQAEHSEREPQLVFVKALTSQNAESNLLVSTSKGRQFSFLVVNHADKSSASKVDFLFRYQPANGFLIEPDALPFATVSETVALQSPDRVPPEPSAVRASLPSANQPTPDLLDELLERQTHAPLPPLIGEQRENNEFKGDRLSAGISEVIDGGQQVLVRFSVLDTSDKPILLMTPQVQLAGKERTGKLVKHQHWSTAEQLPVTDFRLSRRRLGPGERADGVVEFERPPYKQSSESLFLQMADSGAVDKPVLVPIGFGVSTVFEGAKHDK
jgi:hypothetical protein